MDEASRTSSEPSPELSRAGRRRRDAMLGELEKAMRRRHALQTLVRVAVLLVLSFAAVRGLRGWLEAPPRETSEPVARQEPSRSRFPGVLVETRSRYEAIDFGRVERLPARSTPVVRNRPVRADVYLDEAELTRLLGDMDEPIGLVRVGGRTYLASEFAMEWRGRSNPSGH